MNKQEIIEKLETSRSWREAAVSIKDVLNALMQDGIVEEKNDISELREKVARLTETNKQLRAENKQLRAGK